MAYARRDAATGIGLSVVMTLSLVFGATVSAQAQPGDGLAGVSQYRQPTPRRPAAVTLAAANPERETQLEVGALLCKSDQDLVKFQTLITRGASFPGATEAADCHPVPKRTDVEILDHDGPSRTEIVTTDAAKETGWTNSYLP